MNSATSSKRSFDGWREPAGSGLAVEMFRIDASGGLIWPLDRAAMREPAAIVMRMACDIVRRAPRNIPVEALQGIGWRDAQLGAHYLTAKAVVDHMRVL